MAAEKKPTTVRVNVSVAFSGDVPLPPPVGANFFHFTVVGQEVQFLVGSVNLLRFHEAKDRSEPMTVVPQITDRFLLSPLGFATLKAQLEEIAKSVPESDVGVKSRVKQ